MSKNIEHDHTIIKQTDERGFNEDTKQAIMHLYKMGTKTATKIIYSLRDSDILNQVPGINILNIQKPTVEQLNNYLQNTLKPRLLNKYEFNYGELVEWIKNHSEIPDDEHETFVIDFFFEINDKFPSASIFRFSLSTKFLLQLSQSTKHVCTDTTHKILWEGFPVFLTGTTDLRRSYHPSSLSVCTNETATEFEFVFNALKKVQEKLFNYIFRPNCLVADGADAITNGFMKAFNYMSIDDFIRIMCWPHVDRAYKPKLASIKDKEIENAIEDDIFNIQICPSAQIFKLAIKLFEKKWREESDEIDIFIDYFKREWCDSKNCNWYEGAASRIPSNNNGCEGTNRWTKENHTLRNIEGISRFLTTAFRMVKNWSLDRTQNKKFAYFDSIKIEDVSWKMAYQFLYLEPVGTILKKSENSFRLSNDKTLIKTNFLKIDNFENLVNCMLKVFDVELNRTSWCESTCTCFFFNKHYNCFHVLVVAINEKLLDIPYKFRACPIKQKKKPGRPIKESV